MVNQTMLKCCDEILFPRFLEKFSFALSVFNDDSSLCNSHIFAKKGSPIDFQIFLFDLNQTCKIQLAGNCLI